MHTHVYQNECAETFIETLFITVIKMKQSKCPVVFFLTGAQLLYNVVLISTLQPSESAICIHNVDK